MPVYDWKCEKCTKEVEVLHSIADSDVPPEEESVPECTHQWKKFIASPPAKKYGSGWGTRKGHH